MIAWTSMKLGESYVLIGFGAANPSTNETCTYDYG